MNNLEQAFNLLPYSLKKDPIVVVMFEVAIIQLHEAYEEARAFYDLNQIERLPESLLDLVAYERHVDFYNNSLPIETKQKLVKESLYVHRIKGTPAAVKLLIETVFGDGEIEEWFEYNGEPYRFKVLTRNPSATQEKAEEFIKTIDSVKNKRSHLESVILIQSEQMDLYWGGFIHEGTKEIYKQVI